MLIRVVVRIASNAVVCGSAVELWVEQCLPTAIVEAAGKNRIHSPVFAAIRNPPFVGFEACRFKRKFPAIQLLGLAGNHIYDSKKGTRSVQRGTGPRTTSTRSIRSTSSGNSVPNMACS